MIVETKLDHQLDILGSLF